MSFVRFRHGDGSIRFGYQFTEDVLDLSTVSETLELSLSDRFTAVAELLA